MSQFNSKSLASVAVATFDEMIKHFGVVTVMNARVYKRPLYNAENAIFNQQNLKDQKAHDIVKKLLELGTDEYVSIDTLKIANINMEGPTKTVTGGQYVNPLIKFGKTATIEMQDALGRADAIEALGGGIIEEYAVSTGSPSNADIISGYTQVLHLTQDFAGPKTILGESFFIDQKTGAQVKVFIILYEMLPDSIFNLTQDAEGDATVFDLNGSLSAVDILIGDSTMDTDGVVKGTFYSVLPQNTLYNSDKTYYRVSYAAAETAGADVRDIYYLNNTYAKSIEAGTDYTCPVTSDVTGLVFTPSEVTAIAADTVIAVSLS